MRRFTCMLTIFAVVALAALPVAAQDVGKGLAERLKAFDPDAVAAARSYALKFGYKGQMEQVVPNLKEAIIKEVKARNPSLKDQDVSEFLNHFLSSLLVENASVLEDISLIITLETFSKEELIATDEFYSTKIGQSILAKMPKLLARMPEILSAVQTQLLPRALQDAKSKMKQKGIEVQI